jgi:hypothetical protein
LGCRTQQGYGTQYPCRPGERTRESFNSFLDRPWRKPIPEQIALSF